MTDYVLTGRLAQARGVIGRYPDPGDRYIFTFDSVAPRPVHMVGVRKPLRVTWYVGDKPTQSRILPPWIGCGIARCDRIIEKPP